jgi:hypothetical protein
MKRAHIEASFGIPPTTGNPTRKLTITFLLSLSKEDGE